MSTVAHGQDPRIPALSVLSALAEPDGKDFLSMLSGKVVENIQRGTLASRLKNRNLSGNPDAGTIEARRFANSKSQAYGTARAAGRGNAVKAKPVYVHIDIDREIVEEIEHKDVIMLGVSGLLQERSVNHEKTTIRETERAFFQTASDAGMEVVPASTAIEEVLEALILQITTTLNEFVDGVDRDMLDLVLSDTFYSRARNYIDRGVNNAHVSTSAENIVTFHGVRIHPSNYLPNSVKAVCMVNGSVAIPINPRQYTAEKLQLSEAWGVGYFFWYGTAPVMPDLIAVLKEEA